MMPAPPVASIEPLFHAASKSAVLLVDLQRDFLRSEGSHARVWPRAAPPPSPAASRP